MKSNKNSVNSLSTDKLLSNIRFKMLQTHFFKYSLTSYVFTWYANYYSITDTKGGALQEKF